MIWTRDEEASWISCLINHLSFLSRFISLFWVKTSVGIFWRTRSRFWLLCMRSRGFWKSFAIWDWFLCLVSKSLLARLLPGSVLYYLEPVDTGNDATGLIAALLYQKSYLVEQSPLDWKEYRVDHSGDLKSVEHCEEISRCGAVSDSWFPETGDRVWFGSL